MNFSPGTIFVVLLIFGLAAQGLVAWRRTRRDYREHIEKELQNLQLQFVSSVYPGWGRVGPFPKIEVTERYVHSEVPILGSGEYRHYRIVTLRDANGREYRLWALLEFELFRLRHIRWRVEPGQPVPFIMKDMVETGTAVPPKIRPFAIIGVVLLLGAFAFAAAGGPIDIGGNPVVFWSLIGVYAVAFLAVVVFSLKRLIGKS